MPETTLAIEDAPLKGGDFYGTLIIRGQYNITGVNDTSLDKNFSAELNIHQKVFILLEVTENGIYGNVAAADALYEILSTVLYKAKSFRNPGCRDSLHFNPDNSIDFSYIPRWDSMETPPNRKFYIRNLDDLVKLSNFDPLPDYGYMKNRQSSLPVASSISSSLMYYYNKGKEFFSHIYSDKTRSIRLKGHYHIVGSSDEHLKHNAGFNAKLILDHKISSELTHNSSKDKDHLNNMLSTALFKVKAFRNKQCLDAVKFSGEVAVEFDGDTAYTKTFVINDAYSFENFVNYVSHLGLPSLVATAELPLSKPLMSIEDQKQDDSEHNQVANCCTRLKSICG